MRINVGTVLAIIVIGWAIYVFIRDLFKGKW